MYRHKCKRIDIFAVGFQRVKNVLIKFSFLGIRGFAVKGYKQKWKNGICKYRNIF